MSDGEEVLRKEGGSGPDGGHQGSCEGCLEEEFDVVIVAAPQTRDKTKIAGATIESICIKIQVDRTSSGTSEIEILLRM